MKPVIDFDRVSKRYRRYGRKSLRQALSEFGARWVRGLPETESEESWLWAVRDLSFQVLPGQTIGIIGPNGAGKTTTLKLLSRITQPTSGSIERAGRVSALIELGAGFHPELTGRENVFLNGTILGMRRREIAARFDDIVEFAELGPFIDTPVKYYSSGMYARLGFAVAAHSDPQVLLVDEVLAVGDYRFQQRCYDRIRDLQNHGTSILLVSHNLTAVSDTCSEVLVMDRGRPIFHGPTPQGLAEYSGLIRQTTIAKSDIKIGEDGIGQRLVTHGARVVDVMLLDRADQPVQIVRPGERVRLLATIDFYEDAPHPNFSCFVRDERGQLIYDQTTIWQRINTPSFHKGQRATMSFELQMNVVEGIYQIGMDLHYQDLTCYYDRLETAASIVVTDGDGAKGVVDLRCRFTFEESWESEFIQASEAAAR